MSIKSNPLDPRVRRTRELIINAFITVVTKKGFESITVKDITSEATINRATFYAHFPDKYALLDSIISEKFLNILLNKLPSDAILSDYLLAGLAESICEYFDAAKNTCKRGFDSIRPLMGKEIVSQLSEIIYNSIMHHIYDIPEHRTFAKLTAAMVSNSIYSVVSQWEKDGRPISQKQMVDFVVAFESAGVTGALNAIKNKQ